MRKCDLPFPPVTNNNAYSVLQTEVKLKDFAAQFKRACPVELDVIAKKIIEHCLLFFISGSCPKITLYDGVSDAINLSYFLQILLDI